MNVIKQNIIFVALCITLSACTGTEYADIDGGTMMLGANIEGIMHESSRAGEIVKSEMPETIGVYAEIEGSEIRVFDNQCMYYRNGQEVKKTSIDYENWPDGNLWPYQPTKTWIAGKNYTFYGYAPYDAKNTELLLTGANTNTFKFHNIPPLSATEYLVGNGEVVVESGKRPKLQLSHITSRLRFMFAIGEQYNRLRDIKVKSIKISDSGNNTPFWECTVLIGPEVTTQIDVFRGTKIYKSNKDIELIPEGETPHTLISDYTSFSSAYNLLGKIANTTLTVTYDVYDKKDQLLRENQTAKNVIDLSQWDFERGKCYDVKILVSPKYLYVLSDNDVKPDGLIDVDDPTLPTP